MAMAAAGGSEQQAAAAGGEPTPATLDLRVFMAARRGDSEQLKDLLQLEDDEQQGTEQFVMQIDSRSSPPPAAAEAIPALDGGGVTTDGDSLLHVVAACGDGEEFIKCAKMIVRDKEKEAGAAAKRQVLEARNKNGDTPLHCAAGAGNANRISCLLDLVLVDEAKELLRMQNDGGETSLHHAVRAAAMNNKISASTYQLMMSVDPELACIPHQGTSPLYLAISLGELEIARYLFDTTGGKLSYSGPDGRNVLHAAVSSRSQALTMVLKWLKGLKTTADDMQAGDQEAADSLLLQLTMQQDKQNGSTPLHLAASLEGWPWQGFLSWLFQEVDWAVSATTMLLDANASAAYQADNEGSYAVHVAASCSSLGAIKMLLERCPDCATLRDGRGRTFLHVAAEEECECAAVVGYVCGTPQFSSILNAQDKNGDTALHRAVHAGKNLAVFKHLIRNRQVRLDVANADGMTPLDLSWCMTPSEFHYRFNPRNVIQVSLALARAPHGGGRSEVFREKRIKKWDQDKASDDHTNATQVMSLVAVLIATVTFASAFTLPGGYRAADDGESRSNNHYAGTPVLARRYAFDAFILADTLAFICSCLATFTLVYAGVPAMHISIRNRYFNISAMLLQIAGRSFVATFGLGLYVVLAPVDRMVAVAVCVIIFASLLWGNMEAWHMTCLANTVCARLGVRLPQARLYANHLLSRLVVHFGSYIIIFGLPAIRRWARVK